MLINDSVILVLSRPSSHQSQGISPEIFADHAVLPHMSRLRHILREMAVRKVSRTAHTLRLFEEDVERVHTCVSWSSFHVSLSLSSRAAGEALLSSR